MKDLEHRVRAALKDTEAALLQKYELETTIREMYKETKDQRHRIEELVNVNEELLEFSHAKEEQLRELTETNDNMRLHYEEKCAALRVLLSEKDKEMNELQRRIKAGQIGADGILIEKIELQSKIQAFQKESEIQNSRIRELVSINEELLEYAQMKDQQLICMTMQTTCIQESPSTEITLKQQQQQHAEQIHMEVKETNAVGPCEVDGLEGVNGTIKNPSRAL